MPRTHRLGTKPPNHHRQTTAEAALDQAQGYAHIPQIVSLDSIQGPCPGRLGLAQGHRTTTGKQRRKRPWIKPRDTLTSHKPYPWIQSRAHAPDASAWHKATGPSRPNNGGSGPGSSPGIRPPPQTVSLDSIQGPCPGRLGLAQGHRTTTGKQRRKRPWIKSRDTRTSTNRIPGFNPGPMPRTPRLGTKPPDHHRQTTAEAALDQVQGPANNGGSGPGSSPGIRSPPPSHP